MEGEKKLSWLMKKKEREKGKDLKYYLGHQASFSPSRLWQHQELQGFQIGP